MQSAVVRAVCSTNVRVEKSRNHVVTCRTRGGFGRQMGLNPVCAATRNTNRAFVAHAMEDGGSTTPVWSHVMVALVDANPSLSTASRTALQQGARLAMGEGKLTVLILNDQGKEEDPERMTKLKSELEGIGLKNVEVVEESIEHSTGKGSVAIGDAADNFEADLVVMSTNVVHEKHVDANLLAEFVPAPVLFLP